MAMPLPTIAEPRPPRILIVRLSAIGDAIHGMPVACALRARFPEAFLAWAVEDRAAALLQGHPALDELIVLPRGWLKSVGGVLRLRRRLRAARFDVALDVQGLTKSALLAWLSGAPRRIGYAGAAGRELSQWLNNELVETTGPHMIDRYVQLLRPLGIESPEVRFDLPEHEADRAAAEQIVRQTGLSEGFVIVNAGAGWPSKLWPAERYALLSAHLGRAWGLPTLAVWGNAVERARAERIASGSDGFARLAPETSLTVLAALARRAKLFVGSDSGPLHLAAAVGTPCVGLYGPWPREKHGPYGSQHVALQAARFEGSTRQRRHAPPAIMEAITVEMACDACDQILRRDGAISRPADPLTPPASSPPRTDADSSSGRCTS